MKKKIINLVYSEKFALFAKILLILAVTACLIIAVATRISIVSPIDDFNTIGEIIIETQQEDSSLSGIESTKENLENSQTIVVAKFTGNRHSTHYSTLSEMKVERVIKGDKAVEGSNINVYENNALGARRGVLYLRNFTVNNFFQKDKSYLLFLNNTEKFDKDYIKTKGITLDEYVMSDYYLSSFCTEDTDSEILDMDNQNIVDYKDYEDSEFIVFSQKQKETIYQFKKEILNKYL